MIPLAAHEAWRTHDGAATWSEIPRLAIVRREITAIRRD